MITAMSPTLITSRLAEVRAFYERHFDAVTSYDAGWYVVLRLGAEGAPDLCLMEPLGRPEFAGGLTFNLKVPSADEAHEALVVKGGLEPLMPLEDHPWGDRGFCVPDPIGVRLYCYHDIPPSSTGTGLRKPASRGSNGFCWKAEKASLRRASPFEGSVHSACRIPAG